MSLINSGGISLKYFKNNASIILCPKVTFSFLKRLPEFAPVEVVKYVYPYTVPLCLPLSGSSHSTPNHISSPLFSCLIGPSYFTVAN